MGKMKKVATELLKLTWIDTLNRSEYFKLQHNSIKSNLCYTITEEGLHYYEEGNTILYNANSRLVDILNGTMLIIKVPYRPLIGETYYVPALNRCLYDSFIYKGDEADDFNIRHSLTCVTPEEAVELSNKLLLTLKKIRKEV
jgi:hypothetical protein